MNTKDYISLLNRPFTITERQVMELEGILSEFPFFQSARVLHLKGLYDQDSFRYNTELKKTAAYTADRSVLFDFITSGQFQAIQRKYFEDREKSIALIPVTGSEVVLPAVNTPEASVRLSIEKATQGMPETQPEAIREMQEAEENLQIGKPIAFMPEETHSFREWLQLSKPAPIDREKEPAQQEANPEKDKKLELIDKFIESNPKIVPTRDAASVPLNIEKSARDNSSLMTETLARVYLEQKKYHKAIQAYEILILKYPEKSAFFADRITDIKILQQNNK